MFDNPTRDEAKAEAKRRYDLEDNGWRPIETAPWGGEPILLWDRRIAFVGRHIRGDVWDSIPGGFTYRPTHWMPIPAPPPPDL